MEGNGSGKTTLAQFLAGYFPDFLLGVLQGEGRVLDTPISMCREQGTTILAISHGYAFVEQHFSRTIRLANGVITEDGETHSMRLR